jgi:hypothetical protein
MTEQEQCFIKLWKTWKNMQALGDIISYFSPIILIVALKRAQKSNWGKIYDIFSPCVFIFPPLDHAIIDILLQTVYWGENMARGNQIIQCSIKLWETKKKMQAIGDIISYFSPIILIVTLKEHKNPTEGKIDDIFSP